MHNVFPKGVKPTQLIACQAWFDDYDDINLIK